MLKIFEKKGFKQFVVRAAIFFAILLVLQLGIFLFFSKTAFFVEHLAIPAEFYFKILYGLNKQNFLNSAIFVIVSFLLWRRKDILDFKPYKQDYKQTLIFGISAFLFFISHYAFKYWVKLNLEYALDHVTLITALKFSFNLFFIVFLGFAIFNREFIFNFIKKYFKDIIAFSILLILYYYLIWWFHESWFFFSVIIGKSLYFVFSIIFDDVVLLLAPGSGPTLGVGSFFVGISSVCSGIDSLLFFISLFIILVITNWNELNKKRMFLLFIPGIIGTYLLNIIRVFLLVLVGVKISPEFAVDVFHTNGGWILFLVYFIAFWHFGSKWVLKND